MLQNFEGAQALGRRIQRIRDLKHVLANFLDERDLFTDMPRHFYPKFVLLERLVCTDAVSAAAVSSPRLRTSVRVAFVGPKKSQVWFPHPKG